MTCMVFSKSLRTRSVHVVSEVDPCGRSVLAREVVQWGSCSIPLRGPSHVGCEETLCRKAAASCCSGQHVQIDPRAEGTTQKAVDARTKSCNGRTAQPFNASGQKTTALGPQLYTIFTR
eukprot:4947690-Amphidinium_carterae.1